MEFEIRYFRAHGKVDNLTVKAYGNAASDEILRMRGQSEAERARAAAEKVTDWTRAAAEAQAKKVRA